MTDMDVKQADQPFTRLTRLCQSMTDALDDALEAEREEHRGDPEANLTPVKAIVFLEDDEKAGIQIRDYEDSVQAMAALFMHMKAIFQASGRDLEFVGIPDTVEGAEDHD